MPECWFYSRYGECSNEDCMYLHIDPESKIKECAWYARGFCKHGPNCRHKHVRKVLCQAYLSGFCPKGPECPNGHPKYELPSVQRDFDGTEDDIMRGVEMEEKLHVSNVVKRDILLTSALDREEDIMLVETTDYNTSKNSGQ
ncbi:11529_t:CDS:2 [Paraglomus brasilianum]|uniref:mRNA 3'-end-processing protein n=1 Tax=Paraglomus brasilianum TaxID=144538 RepID=A0A9N8VX17_9GLOM|nr:11529_t:CDS:2 [Paraglomus brasilianum]